MGRQNKDDLDVLPLRSQEGSVLADRLDSAGEVLVRSSMLAIGDIQGKAYQRRDRKMKRRGSSSTVVSGRSRKRWLLRIHCIFGWTGEYEVIRGFAFKLRLKIVFHLFHTRSVAHYCLSIR